MTPEPFPHPCSPAPNDRRWTLFASSFFNPLVVVGSRAIVAEVESQTPRPSRFADVGNRCHSRLCYFPAPDFPAHVVVVIVLEDEISIRLPVVSALEAADNSCRFGSGG
jgi:hypothetical protein